jgi:hypothetical protein
MDITKRKFICFPPKRTFVKLTEPTSTLCEICHQYPAKFLLKNSLLLCCHTYGYKCTTEVPEGSFCYGCGKPATLIQSCGPVCGEGKAQVKCPVAAKSNHEAQVGGYLKRLEDPELRKQRQDKFEVTMVERYGAKSAVNVPELAQKIKDTNMERYGVEHGPQIPGVFDKTRAQYQETHGVDHWTQLPSTQKKRKETNLETYGFENAIQSEEVVERRREHNFEKYGVGHPQQIPETAAARYETWKFNQDGMKFGSTAWRIKFNIAERYRKTCLERYGVNHPFQDAKTYTTKVLPFMYRTHQLTLPSGRVVNYQGYEDRAILFLLRSFAEDELAFESEITFPWTDYEGDKHTYFPDLCIRTKQTAIEVKSEFTLMTSLADGTLLQKLLAVRSHGWLPAVQLWDKDGDEPLKVLILDDFPFL